MHLDRALSTASKRRSSRGFAALTSLCLLACSAGPEGNASSVRSFQGADPGSNDQGNGTLQPGDGDNSGSNGSNGSSNGNSEDGASGNSEGNGTGSGNEGANDGFVNGTNDGFDDGGGSNGSSDSNGNANPGSNDPAGNDPGGNDPGGNDPAGNDPAGNDPAGNDPAGNDPGGDDPGSNDPGGNDPGGFDSVPVSGGASAAFVCPQGGNFGNPLDNMGAVQSVGAPQGSFFAFIEGPVWIGSRNTLFFSDNASGPERIWQISAPFTTPSVFMPDSGSNGLAVDNQDQLLLADQARDRIVRVDSGNAQIIGTVGPTGGFNPNDLILRSDDNLYFTDPNGAGRGFHRVSPAGEASGPFTQANAPNAPNSPNGIVLSPDENLLYVGDVNANFVSTFSLEPDGSVDTQSGQVFVNAQGALVDGMAVDCAGNLYIGTQTGVEVYSPDGGSIGTIPTGEASNATFGGADRRTLFVTSRSQLKFVTLGVPGLPN